MAEEKPILDGRPVPLKKRRRIDLSIDIPWFDGTSVISPQPESQPVPPEPLPNPPQELAETLTQETPAPELECLEKEELPKGPPPSPASPSQPRVPPTFLRPKASGLASPWGLTEEDDPSVLAQSSLGVIIISSSEESSSGEFSSEETSEETTNPSSE